MKKVNFKKMAIMGMTGGMILTSQSVQGDTLLAANNHTYAMNGCGGKNGCGGSRGKEEKNGQKRMKNHQERKAAAMIDEEDLWKDLTHDSRQLYDSLDHEGRAYARKLASEYHDKNQAVRDAARQAATKNLEKIRRK